MEHLKTRRDELAASGVDVRNRDVNGRVVPASKRTPTMNGKPYTEKKSFGLAWTFGFLMVGHAALTHLMFGYSLTEMVTKLPENPFWCGIFILLLLQTIGAVLLELDVSPTLSVLLLAGPYGVFGLLEIILKGCLYVLLAILAVPMLLVFPLIPVFTGMGIAGFFKSLLGG